MDKLKQVIFENLDHAEECADYWAEKALEDDWKQYSKYKDYESRWRFVAACIRNILDDTGIKNEYEEWRDSDD